MIYYFVDLKTVDKFYKKLMGLDRFLIILFLLGATVTVISLFRGILVDRSVKVEYLSEDKIGLTEANHTIFVDVEGAVIFKGVYELPVGSRVKDALISAGGYAEDADREYCEKMINMAEELKDGQKIFIPIVNNTNTIYGYNEANIAINIVNINTASVAELDTLVGIGSVRAESIVKNRPYQSIDELVSKKVIPSSVLEDNRDRLSVY